MSAPAIVVPTSLAAAKGAYRSWDLRQSLPCTEIAAALDDWAAEFLTPSVDARLHRAGPRCER